MTESSGVGSLIGATIMRPISPEHGAQASVLDVHERGVGGAAFIAPPMAEGLPGMVPGAASHAGAGVALPPRSRPIAAAPAVAVPGAWADRTDAAAGKAPIAPTTTAPLPPQLQEAIDLGIVNVTNGARGTALSQWDGDVGEDDDRDADGAGGGGGGGGRVGQPETAMWAMPRAVGASDGEQMVAVTVAVLPTVGAAASDSALAGGTA